MRARSARHLLHQRSFLSIVIKRKTLPISFFILAAVLVGTVSVKADAVNEKRILRKAGGPADGTLSNVIVKLYDPQGNFVMESNLGTRTGSVKIPNSTGKAKSMVEHGGPEDGLDGTAAGKLKKAKVTRGGKKIVYKANGTAEPVLDDEGLFSGSGSAVSTIKGSKVKSAAKLRGARTLMDGGSEVVTAVATATGKF